MSRKFLSRSFGIWHQPVDVDVGEGYLFLHCFRFWRRSSTLWTRLPSSEHLFWSSWQHGWLLLHALSLAEVLCSLELLPSSVSTIYCTHYFEVKSKCGSMARSGPSPPPHLKFWDPTMDQLLSHFIFSLELFCVTIFKASLCSPNTFLTTCKLKVESYSFRSVYLSLHCFTYNFDLFFDGNLDRSLTLGDTSCKVRSQIQIALKSLDPYLKTKWAFRQFHWLTAINLITSDMIQKSDITFRVNG